MPNRWKNRNLNKEIKDINKNQEVLELINTITKIENSKNDLNSRIKCQGDNLWPGKPEDRTTEITLPEHPEKTMDWRKRKKEGRREGRKEGRKGRERRKEGKKEGRKERKKGQKGRKKEINRALRTSRTTIKYY